MCGCSETKEDIYGSFHDYLTRYHWKLKNCECHKQYPENKEEKYELRKLKFHKDGQVITEPKYKGQQLQKGELRKAFCSGFPCGHRGIFLVTVNKEHCVVFDGSRQCIIDSSYPIPISFNNFDDNMTSAADQMKTLLNGLGYKTIDQVYQLYSKNSRFSVPRPALDNINGVQPATVFMDNMNGVQPDTVFNNNPYIDKSNGEGDKGSSNDKDEKYTTKALID